MTVSAVKIVCGLVFIFVGLVNAAPSSKLPKHFVRCKLNDPAFQECIKHGLQSAVPHLAKGVPSLGLLPTDPLQISTLVINKGDGAVRLNQTYTNLDITNLRTVILDELEYNPTKYIFDIKMHVEKPVVLEGHYSMNGHVMILPITGNGTCKFVLDNLKSICKVQMKPIVKNDVTYLEIQTLSWKFSTTKMHMRLNNLFNGDKTLGENMNVFLNENWEELLNDMKPAFENALGSAFIGIAQAFFKRVPLNEMFLE